MIENLTVTLSPSGSQFTNNNKYYDNWTFVQLPSDLMQPEEEDNNEQIVRMIQIIARPPIIILGTIGNLLTFFTMQRGSLRSMSTCFYMAILALADTGGVWSFILLNIYKFS